MYTFPSNNKMYKHYIRLYKSYETGIYTVIQNHDTTKITSQYEGCNKEDGHFLLNFVIIE